MPTRKSIETAYANRVYVTVPEAMRWLSLSRDAVDDRIDTGRFKITLDGIRRKINVRSILADIECESVAA